MHPTFVRRSLLASLALALFAPAAARAQAVITGTVRSDGGAPIGSAIVLVRRLRLSAITNEAGVYRMVVPSDRVLAGEDTVRVTRLGFRPAEVVFAPRTGTVTVDVTMNAQAIALDQVVVTGTAGNQERRAQAAVVATIDAADILTKSPVRDVNELLYARTPGVSMSRASGTSGSNTRIDIRGQASVSLSNYPLVFIDGVRVVSGPRGVAQAPGGTTGGAGGQMLNALNDINPDDIESIEIVKGPAASTLYGSDASAGVIQILTKKGRAGSRRFSQSVTTEYNDIDPDFTPWTNYAKCTAPLVAANSPNPLCRGQVAGTVVSDNPLVRDDVLRDGWSGALQYSAQGGGENFGYYGSFNASNEEGTTPGSHLNHRSGRVNMNWVASPKLSFDVSVPLIRTSDKLPQGDQSSFGYLIGGGFGSPLSVREASDGGLTGGWLNNNLTVDAISAINTRNLTSRTTPSIQGRFAPVSWFNNRMTVGADLARTTSSQFFPRNDRNFYSALANTGSLAVTEANIAIYTVDYLGNVSHKFGSDNIFSSDLSFGSQWINTVATSVSATGQGLLTNSNNLISGATTTTASQGFNESRSLGFFVQEQIGFRDRLFIQLGGRADRNSAFGESVGTYFLPKGGISWVVSEEGLWSGLRSAIPTLRLRAAYGTTGRSPSGTATLQTYLRSNFITDAGLVLPGVSPGNPGNPDLKPERGTEFEAGFDAGFFRDRVGLELTYFNKVSKDLILPLPLPPSSGFASNPLVNIGEVRNSGLEIGLRATPIEGPRFVWDANLNLNTLSNEIESMGSITPFISNNQCFKPGIELAAWCVPVVLSVDTVAGRTIVSDTARMAGGQLPKYGGSFSSTFTFLRAFRVFALVDGKFDYHVYNLTRDFRDRSLRNSAESQLPRGQGGDSVVDSLRRFGPFVTETGGTPVGTALVRGPYISDGDYVRFRELSLTWSVPASLIRGIGLGGASLSVGGRNLGLWTKYDGFDPEVMGVENTTPFLGDVFTMPQSKRLFARLNVQF